jgi:hypothetical protein
MHAFDHAGNNAAVVWPIRADWTAPTTALTGAGRRSTLTTGQKVQLDIRGTDPKPNGTGTASGARQTAVTHDGTREIARAASADGCSSDCSTATSVTFDGDEPFPLLDRFTGPSDTALDDHSADRGGRWESQSAGPARAIEHLPNCSS